MRKTKKEKGITLVALIITIVVLLILAAVAITQLIDKSIFENTELATQNHKMSENTEIIPGKPRFSLKILLQKPASGVIILPYDSRNRGETRKRLSFYMVCYEKKPVNPQRIFFPSYSQWKP